MRGVSRSRMAVRMQQFLAEERATRPDGIVTAGIGDDAQRLTRLREKHGLPQPQPVRPAAGVDDADMIDRD